MEFGYEILTSLLGLGYSSPRGRSITVISSFLCFGHHDEVGILSSGSPSSYERDQGEKLWKNASPKSWASDGELNGKYTRYPMSCISVNSLSAIYDGTKVSNG